MAIPKRGSRNIYVAGANYRWYVRPRPTHSQTDLVSALHVGVQGELESGQVLQVITARFHPSAAMTLQPEPVLPSDVAEWIDAALSAGWTPNKPGPTFTFVGESSDCSLESILDEVDLLAGGAGFLNIWVPDALTMHGQPVTSDIAMAIIVDRLLSHDLLPDGYVARPGGRLYRYRRESGLA